MNINTPFGRNVWTRKQIDEFEIRTGIRQGDELPLLIESAFLQKRYNRSPVTIWRWVKRGILPQPIKLGDTQS